MPHFQAKWSRFANLHPETIFLEYFHVFKAKTRLFKVKTRIKDLVFAVPQFYSDIFYTEQFSTNFFYIVQ